MSIIRSSTGSSRDRLPECIVRVPECIVGLFVVSQLIFAAPISGQDCFSPTDSLRAVWEEDARERRSIVDRTMELARDEGVRDPGGWVVVSTDAKDRDTRVRYVGLDLPETVFLEMRALLAGYLQARPLERRNLVIELGAPKIPFTGEERESCPARLRNDSKIQLLWALMIDEHPEFEPGEEPPTADVGLLIDSEGQTVYAEVERPTGDRWFDERLVPLAREMEFAPARMNGTPVPTFTTRTIGPMDISETDVETREPILINVDRVRNALQRHYPEEAKRLDVNARVILWLLVDASGEVEEVEVHDTRVTGVHGKLSHEWEFERAARTVARRMRFQPAMSDGEPSAVWIAQPVTFQVR